MIGDQDFGPGLYIVATPIGNLADVTLRALATLAAADEVLCEDTRVTARLLNRFAITTPKKVYNDHNAARVRPRVLKALAQGRLVALVSDAGTPLLSDPGYKLVNAALEADVPVFAVPGASAVTAALAVAGLPTDKFSFAGFLPVRPAARRQRLRELAGAPGTLVLFESARRLPAALVDMAKVLGERPAAVARELTKTFEEVARGDLGELARRYGESGPPKGEVTVLVAPGGAGSSAEGTAESLLAEALKTLSVRDAAAAVSGATGLPKKTVYRMALKQRQP